MPKPDHDPEKEQGPPAGEEEPRRGRVRVPTVRDALGYSGWVECDPEAAAHWDARRWERLS